MTHDNSTSTAPAHSSGAHASAPSETATARLRRSNPASGFTIVFAGGLGGAFTPLFFLALLCIQNSKQLPSSSFYLGMALFGIIGATMAWIWQETDLKRAFYIGLGLPAFFNASLANFSSLPGSTKPSADGASQTNGAWNLFPQVYAADAASFLGQQATNRLRGTAALKANESDPLNLWTNRILVLQPHGELASYRIELLAQNRSVLESYLFDASKTNSVLIPDETTSIILSGPRFSSVTEWIPTNSVIRLDLETDRRFWSEFQKAVGVKGVKEYQVQVQARPVRSESISAEQLTLPQKQSLEIFQMQRIGP